MLSRIKCNDMVTKEEVRQNIKPEIQLLSERLSVLQQRLKEAKIPMIVVFEGWGAAGKGSLIGKLILNMDPRGFQVYATNRSTEEELRKPYLNRFWNDIPGRGDIAIFDKSWYLDYSNNKKESINIFERQLTDDNYLIVKYFIHISEQEQKKRLEQLLSNKNTAWRVNDKDLKQNRLYDKAYKEYDKMLKDTNTESAPWNIIDGTDKNIALYNIVSVLVNSIEDKIAHKDAEHKGIPASKMQLPLIKMPKLKDVNLDCSMEEDVYRKQLEKLQKRLKKLSYKLYKKNIPLIICYEGWDAAGKGGNIKRVVSCLDPRDYDVTPIAAPDFYEARRHYLWRFWKYIPKTGHAQIFDRTWYGRVMVERLEGFCTKEEWKRAYNEINEFEKELTDWGAIVVKFWLQIDKDEQLKRFTERQNTPEKQWKITDEDWRNREKWDEYEIAVNNMIQYTSTKNAPWTIIESNCKYYARVKAIKTIISAIEKRLQ